MPDIPDSQALTPAQKIDFFEHRIKLWMLEPAQALAERVDESGWSVLQITLPYFEMIGKFRAGYCATGKALNFFKEGFKWVFMESPDNVPVQAGRLDALLIQAFHSLNAGLWHTSLTNPHILLNHETIVPLKVHFLSTRKDYIEINPRLITAPLTENFEAYLAELRDPSAALDPVRARFEARFDWLESAEFKPPA
jgi:hypothetical protein